MSRRILVIDDEESLSETIGTACVSGRTEVSWVRSPRSALALLEAHFHSVVFCDLGLIEHDGAERLLHLRRHPGAALILTSRGKPDELADEALRRGAWGALAKPTSPPEVALLLDRAFERERGNHARNLLSRELRRSAPGWPIVAASDPMIALVEALEAASNEEAHVLLDGERHTEKEQIARTLHAQSARRNRGFAAVDCARGTPTTLERELFGETRSAGWEAGDPGALLEARGGSIFLDEIAALPGPLQEKLLTWLDKNSQDVPGNDGSANSDVRVIAASSRDLREAVAEGSFCKDLYERLSGIRLTVPALRERPQDIPLLVDHFLRSFGRSLEKPGLSIRDHALQHLTQYHWPGNIRELENVIERVALIARHGPIGTELLPRAVVQETSPKKPWACDPSLRSARRRAEIATIEDALEATDGNRTHAARRLQISHRSLLYKIKEYRLGSR